jgi:hypothetical protein
MINQRYLRLLKEFIANPSSKTWEPLIELRDKQGVPAAWCIYKTFTGAVDYCPTECVRATRLKREVGGFTGTYLCYCATRKYAWRESPGNTLALAIQFLAFLMSKDEENRHTKSNNRLKENK